MRRAALLLFTIAGLHAQSGYRYYISGDPADVSPPVTPGVLLAGGGKDVDSAFRWFLARAGGGDILVLRGSGADGYHSYFQELAPVNSVETIVFQSPAAATAPFVLDKIRRAEAIFFAGGDQWNYVRLWRGSPVQQALNDAIRRGVPVGGTSAGLAILSQYAFSAEFDTVTTPQALADPFDKRVALFRGLLSIPGLECLITDSHFAARDRMGRLLVFLGRIRAEDRCSNVRGIGIDERTAVALDGRGQAQVLGEGAAWLVRLRKPVRLAPGRPAEIPAMDVRPVRAGHGFRWKDWERRGPGRYRLSVEAGVVKSSAGGIYPAPGTETSR